MFERLGKTECIDTVYHLKNHTQDCDQEDDAKDTAKTQHVQDQIYRY